MGKAVHKSATHARAIARTMDGAPGMFENLTASTPFGDDNSVLDKLAERVEKRLRTQRANKAEHESRLALRKF